MSKILEFSALLKIKNWNFLQIFFLNSMKNWYSWNFLVPDFSLMQCSVWKLSVPEFCFTENTWIRIVHFDMWKLNERCFVTITNFSSILKTKTLHPRVRSIRVNWICGDFSLCSKYAKAIKPNNCCCTHCFSKAEVPLTWWHKSPSHFLSFAEVIEVMQNCIW